MEFGNWIGADSGMNLCPLACTYKGFGGLDTPYRDYVEMPKGAIANHINPFWFNQSPKAVYYTPAVNGFQAGVSYTPSENNFFEPTPRPTSEQDGQQKDIVGLGAQWNGDFGGTTVGFSAVGAVSDGATSKTDAAYKKEMLTAAKYAEFRAKPPEESGMTRRTVQILDDGGAHVETYTPAKTSQMEGLGYYELTGKVGFGGFVFAGTWWDFGDGRAPKGSNQDYTGWGVDASYAFGPYGLEVQYAHAEKTTNSMGTSTSSDFDGWNVSLGYSIAPGLKWYGEVTRGSYDVMGTEEPNGDGEYTGTVFLSGLYLNF